MSNVTSLQKKPSSFWAFLPPPVRPGPLAFFPADPNHPTDAERDEMQKSMADYAVRNQEFLKAEERYAYDVSKQAFARNAALQLLASWTLPVGGAKADDALLDKAVSVAMGLANRLYVDP